MPNHTKNETLAPTAKVRMLIRRPVEEVFAAITSADTLTKFWLSSASGPLALGKTIRWEFRVPGASVESFVKELVPNERILIEWSDGTTLEWKFERRADGSTVLEVENRGFAGDPREAIATALESTQGFAIVVCDLKSLLEHGTSMGFVRDKAALITEALNEKR